MALRSTESPLDEHGKGVLVLDMTESFETTGPQEHFRRLCTRIGVWGNVLRDRGRRIVED